MSSRGFRRSEWIFCLFLALLTAKVYGEVFTSDFIRFDDPRYVTKNPEVLAGLSWEGAKWAFTTLFKSNWHPLAWISHMLDVSFFGVNAGAHHATSVILHILNSVLLFAVFRAATGAAGASAFVAAVFAIHPTHVESVAWVAERKDVLSTFFGLLSTAFYIAYARRGGSARYLAVLFFFVCSLASKAMLVTLPFVFLLLDYWPLGRLRFGSPARRILVEKLPMLVATVVISGLTFAAQTRSGAVGLGESVTLSERTANAVVSYILYIGKTLWPADLALVYPHPYLPGGIPWQVWQVVASAAVLICVTAAVLIARRRPYLAVGWLWFLVTLVPVIGIVQAGTQGFADRYTYVSCVGLTLMLAWGARDLCRRVSLGVFPLVAAGLAITLLAATAQRQVHYWRDSVTLFEHSLQIAPGAMSLRNNLANELFDRGKIDASIVQYRRLIEIDPTYSIAHRNMSNALLKRGEPYEAMRHALMGRRIDLDSLEGQLRLGRVRAGEGLLANAEIHFQRAVELAPESAAAHHEFGEILIRRGNLDMAIVHLRRAVDIEPDDPEHLEFLENALRTQRERRAR